MSQFYARYIPPSTKPAPLPTSTDEKASQALKRPTSTKTNHSAKKRKIDVADAGNEILSNYKVSQPSQSHAKHDSSAKLKQNAIVDADEGAKKKDVADKPNRGHHDSSIGDARHSKVLSRLQKSQAKSGRSAINEESAIEDGNSRNDVHPDRQKMVGDLQPIPQPIVESSIDTPIISYSTVPEWLRSPLRVDDSVRHNFDQLELDADMLHNLAKQDKTSALPVQAAVLPLLCNLEVDARPDLCIAAATGSGKTLAYVLPIINALKGRKQVQLKAVVVVPTRALVKQVVQAFSSCSDGLQLKTGTAEGSKTLADEQDQLVDIKKVYNPVKYRQRAAAPLDWDSFDLRTLLDELTNEDPCANVGYVKEYRSKVDVLVCTPGRLIEHLQATEGFNLDHVEWFVADEADRLLNESYHDWLDVVLPSLKTQAATVARDTALRKMYMDIPQRRVTKVLLSATMTSDVSQLMALDLRDPRLVVVGTVKDTEQAHEEQVESEFYLPSRLQETAVALKDSQNKPLYLLKLLHDQVLALNKPAAEPSAKPGASLSSDDSSSSISDSESGTDTSSDESDSESDSEADSDDSSSSTSSNSTAESTSPKTTKSLEARKSTVKPSSTLQSRVLPRALIFTKSTESAHRLGRLLALLDPSLTKFIDTFTKSPANTDNKKSASKAITRTRAKILQAFTNGATRVLICTDLAARGLDIPSLEHVINYDVPASALTYVHRVGRTARAGMAGHAWSLVEHKQGKWFWEVIGGKTSKGHAKNSIVRGTRSIQKLSIALDMEAWTEKYEAALSKLGEDVRS